MNPRIVTALVLLLVTAGCREEKSDPAVVVRTGGHLELSLCTFNVRYRTSADGGWRAWPNRVDRVVRTIRLMDPDVLGVQEALHGQAADLRASLPDYAFHGVGRDDGGRTGEYAAIFYRAERFELDPEEHGTFWLSDFPERPGSKTWGNEVVRCTSWLRLIDRVSGRGFYVFNTHFDHRHQLSREKAADLIVGRITTRKHPSDPVILLGDFNATEKNPALRRLLDSGLGNPFFALHPDIQDRRTAHSWSGRSDGPFKIDHILVSAGARYEAAGIHRAPSRREQPSDHYPVWADVSWPGPASP